MKHLQIEKLCTQRGIKLTEQRKIIAKVVCEANDHPHVEEIYRRANLKDNKISLATTYRTINLLTELGLIEKLQFGDGKARYESVDDEAHNHHHLINVKTGEIIEFTDTELEALKQRIAQRLGYKLLDYRLELYGTPLEE